MAEEAAQAQAAAEKAAQAQAAAEKAAQERTAASAPKPEIIVRQATCRTTGAGTYLVELAGDASGPPDTGYLLYTEVEDARGGSRQRPDCSDWRAAQLADDKLWWRVSCFHQPADRPFTHWRMSTTIQGGRPTEAFVGMLKPNMGKTFITHWKRPINCS